MTKISANTMPGTVRANSRRRRTSKRSQEFLRYVVDHTLAGQGDLLKERTIGMEVFGRPDSYDPSDDATFWYVGDYFKAAGAARSTHIGSFRVP